MRTELKEALHGSKNMPLWLDRPDRPQTAPCLSARVETELAIVGAGFSGLWAALLAKEALEIIKEHPVKHRVFRMSLAVDPCHGREDDSRNRPRN